MLIDRSFWQGRRVLVTGHTGFKGGWLSLWLQQLGATVVGYALPPVGQHRLFDALRLQDGMSHVVGDIRDQARLQGVMDAHRIEVVFHLAAQALVRPSYVDPVETYDVNVMGSLKVLECVRRCETVRAVVMVTTDKCYRNHEWCWGYREIDPMGGHDPYSASKGAMELMVDSHRNAFFSAAEYARHGKAIATARAGNVIGGGDWCEDRLVPDLVRAFAAGQPALIRNRHAIRPWQHVFQPLGGYMVLAQYLFLEGSAFAEAWNFGPRDEDCQPVGAVAQRLASLWASQVQLRDETQPDAPHEAHFLKLDSAKARSRLAWRGRTSLDEALAMTAAWYQAFYQGQNVHALSLAQIERYTRPELKEHHEV